MAGSASTDGRDSDWTEARSVISRFDGYSTSLRQTGFTVVSALLAAAGFLDETGSSAYTPAVKVGVIFATLSLLVTLRFLDTQYQVSHKAASVRAKILEKSLDQDITTSMAFYRQNNRLEARISAIYYAFAFIAFGLGLFVLGTTSGQFVSVWAYPWTLYLLCLIFLVSLLFIFLAGLSNLHAPVDWTVDRKSVPAGSPIRLTFTSLLNEGKRTLPFQTRWSVYEGPIPRMKAPLDSQSAGANLPYLRSHDWLWDTQGLPAGLYVLECEWQFAGKGTEAFAKLLAVGFWKRLRVILSLFRAYFLGLSITFVPSIGLVSISFASTLQILNELENAPSTQPPTPVFAPPKPEPPTTPSPPPASPVTLPPPPTAAPSPPPSIYLEPFPAPEAPPSLSFSRAPPLPPVAHPSAPSHGSWVAPLANCHSIVVQLTAAPTPSPLTPAQSQPSHPSPAHATAKPPRASSAGPLPTA